MSDVPPTPKPKWAVSIPDDIFYSVFRLEVKTPQGRIAQDIYPFVHFDYHADPSGDTLIQEVSEIAAKYSFWSMVLADGKFAVAVAKRKVLHRRGKVMNEILQQARIEGVSAPRRQDVEDLIEADPELTKANLELMLAERTESKLLGVVLSLKVKSEELRTLAGFKKQEIQELSDS